MTTEQLHEIMTPEQAADYLQVNRDTVYRYIREGKLVASRIGRAYRIPRSSLDLLLWSTRTREDLTLRQYTRQEIEQFLQDDRLDAEAQSIADRFLEGAVQPRSESLRGTEPPSQPHEH
jgi:excisionase family DNA binding protein